MNKVEWTDEKIYKKIESIYATEGGKKFITHLLYSFFPTSKSDFMWDDPTDGRPMKCCITDIPLMSKSGAMQLSMDTMPESIKYISDKLKWEQENEDCFDEEGKRIPCKEFKTPLPEHPMIKAAAGRVLGVECKDSKKLLCQNAYQQLLNFYQNKILCGDNHINYIAKQSRLKESINYMKEKEIIRTPEEEKVVRKNVETPKKVTFGDMIQLQELKKRMEENEK